VVTLVHSYAKLCQYVDQHKGACRRKWQLTDTDLCLVARPRRCLTLSNPVSCQNWMAAYLGYTLRMRKLFRGWSIMVNDTHTRRRRSTKVPCPETCFEKIANIKVVCPIMWIYDICAADTGMYYDYYCQNHYIIHQLHPAQEPNPHSWPGRPKPPLFNKSNTD